MVHQVRDLTIDELKSMRMTRSFSVLDDECKANLGDYIELRQREELGEELSEDDKKRKETLEDEFGNQPDIDDCITEMLEMRKKY